MSNNNHNHNHINNVEEEDDEEENDDDESSSKEEDDTDEEEEEEIDLFSKLLSSTSVIPRIKTTTSLLLKSSSSSTNVPMKIHHKEDMSTVAATTLSLPIKNTMSKSNANVSTNANTNTNVIKSKSWKATYAHKLGRTVKTNALLRDDDDYNDDEYDEYSQQQQDNNIQKSKTLKNNKKLFDKINKLNVNGKGGKASYNNNRKVPLNMVDDDNQSDNSDSDNIHQVDQNIWDTHLIKGDRPRHHPQQRSVSGMRGGSSADSDTAPDSGGPLQIIQEVLPYDSQLDGDEDGDYN